MREHFRAFARYNRWANARLSAAVGTLGEEEYRADRGAFFRSLHGTLNHLLLGDRLWLARITGERDPSLPSRLDAILHEDRDALAAARAREDERIVAVVDGLDEGRLAAPLRYRTVQGVEHEQPLAEVLAHVFNHQTHHRGQAHAVLTGLGREAPPLDLINYLREAAAAAAGRPPA
jgi:uncharacterized damage-inducible protein DinB